MTGNTATASVVVNVKFQSNVPIALDDIFSVPTNSTNRPLAVLDNDISSINGGLAITSVSAGTEGGIISVVAGGQSIRYTPQENFSGTEQFLYTIQDGAGLVSQATVTVNMLPGHWRRPAGIRHRDHGCHQRWCDRIVTVGQKFAQ